MEAGEQQLRLLAAAVRDTQESILITDAMLEPPGPAIVFVNEAFTGMTGYTAAEMLGRTPRLLQGPQTDLALMKRLKEDLRAGRRFKGETTNYRKDGSPFIIEWLISPVTDQSGLVTHYVSVQRDVTAQRQQEQALRASEERLTLAVEGGGLGLWDWDISTNKVFYSERWARMIGYAPEDIEPHFSAWDRLVHPHDKEEVLRETREWLAGERQTYQPEFRMWHKQGHWHWIQGYGRIAGRDERGKPVRVVGTHLDIHERRLAEEGQRSAMKQLSARERYLNTVLATVPDCVMVVSATGELLEMNPAGLTMLEAQSFDEVKGAAVYSFIDAPDRSAFASASQDILRGAESGELEFAVTGLKGGRRVLEAHVAPLLDDNDGTIAILSTTRDVTERRRLTDMLAYQAHHDALTGVPNRRGFAKAIQDALVEANDNQTTFAVIYLDLDNFKHINDTLGHIVGDELLRAVAGRLSRMLGPGESLARMGGDEFLIIVPRALEANRDPRQTIHRFLGALRQSFSMGGRELFVSATAGLSIYPNHGTTAEDLCSRADQALCLAKARRRGSFEIFKSSQSEGALPTSQVAVDRVTLMTDLHRALDRSELRLAYQPQFSIADGTLTGFEALLRWVHPTLGVLAPSAFISLAEDSGLIIPMGAWVLTEVCRQLNAWREAGLRATRVSVNVSAAQFTERSFVSDLRRLLDSTKINPAHICLKLTESLMLQEAAAKSVQRLRRPGVAIALDDFGTGYSSLAYLDRLQIDELKIDKAFVSGIRQPKAKFPLVRSIIALGKSLGLTVVAEGVATAFQLDVLAQLGCTAVQGYYTGPPLRADHAESVLIAGQWHRHQGLGEYGGDRKGFSPRSARIPLTKGAAAGSTGLQSDSPQREEQHWCDQQ